MMQQTSVFRRALDNAVVELRKTKDALCDVLTDESKIGNQTRLRVLRNPARFKQTAIAWTWRAGMAVLALFLGMWASSVWNAVEEPVRQPWMPCVNDPDAHAASGRLATVTMAHAETHGSWCTTLDTALSMPCLCCVKASRCWSGVEISKNYTALMGNSFDTVGGRRLRRRLPSAMRVCYTMGHAAECVHEEGPTVPRLLRAIEQLNGWAPAGTEIVDYIAPAGARE